jgi:hypothetical protein
MSITTMNHYRKVILLWIAMAVVLTLSIASLSAQAPDTLWTRIFGGSAFDFGNCAQQTSDGGYVVVGGTESYGAGSADVWLIRTDSDGKKVWEATFGDTGDDRGYFLSQTADGGYIIVGLTDSYGAGGTDVWLIMTDSAGNMIWDKTIGGTDHDYGSAIQKTSDGGYILVGATCSCGTGSWDVWLIKTDSAGNKIWDKTFGGTGGDYGESVQQSSDGGYIIAGYTGPVIAADILLIKIDGKGNKIWDKTFGGTDWDKGSSVLQTNDGGYIIVGGTESYGTGISDIWLIKTDGAGNKIWDKTFGGDDGDVGECVQSTSDGGYIITGRTGPDVAADIWVIRTDCSGNKLWDRVFGSNNSDDARFVQQTSDGGFLIVGEMDGGLYLIKLKPEE